MTPPERDSAAPGLDLAVDWMQRSIDDLAEATRRTKALGATPAVDLSKLKLPADLARWAGAPATAEAASRDRRPVRAPAKPNPAQPTSAKLPAPAPTGPRPTPLLDSIGREITKLAAAGSLAPVIGRDEETAWIIEILLRTSKRNPVLLGPPGVGKTAIVEGLAQRIVAGRVPPPLRGVRIIEVPLSSLTAGTQYRGQLEERIAQLVAEASQPSIILFVDEIHLLAGLGRSEGGMGVGQALKPALARGDIAVIGATTAEAYRTTIAEDEALARRFTTVMVPELDRAASRPILVSIRDVLAKSRGVTVSDDALAVLLDFADTSIANRRFPDKAIDLLQQAIAGAIVAGRTTVDRDAAVATTERWSARATSTPTLERFGRDLVALARDAKLGPIVGRDREIDAIVEVLLRRTKRNPLLLGRAGSGKTAIVEGLAIRIASGTVPEALRDIHLFDVPLLSLASAVAAESSLLGDLLQECRHPSVIVFFDEIHLLVAPTVRDLAESLKPALARGEIACIGATTSEEYQAYLESETALARRFSEIHVEPMDDAAAHTVLVAVRDSLAGLRGIRVSDEALDEIIALADQFMPNRTFPDKGVDLIEQSVAYAISHGRTAVDVATAREAVAGLLGMPLDPTGSLAELATALREGALLDDEPAAALLGRLAVSMRGFDARKEMPDAVILLCDGAASSADAIADALAGCLFRRPTARIEIDLSGMTDDSSISTLLGSAPGLIGSDRPLALHELRRSPWQVVTLRGIDGCALSVRETIAAALGSGSFTDAMGRTIPLGAAIVILTAPLVGGEEGDAPAAAVLAASLGPALMAACDVVVGAGAGPVDEARATWIGHRLLDPLGARLARRGFPVTFDPGFVSWLGGRLPADGTSPEAFVDREVTPALVAALPRVPGRITVRVVDDRPSVTAAGQPARGAGPPGP